MNANELNGLPEGYVAVWDEPTGKTFALFKDGSQLRLEAGEWVNHASFPPGAVRSWWQRYRNARVEGVPVVRQVFVDRASDV